ncbi:MAG: cation transporter [Chloroflexi bacterium HGW-Chloroflexi-4]|jgi:cobalt-zinc-cadmium efflux system protein|nr:MAG: cation transporter [Chloroflexi bacterium HGW-Chloroflexi-4]
MIAKNNGSIQKRFIYSIVLTSLILVAEIIGGLVSGSLALLSDAAHVFMDIFALVLSFVALKLAIRPPDDQHSFGWYRLEVVAALINGASLFIISIGIWIEAVKRFQNPVEVKSTEMLIIAAIGLVVNLVVAFILDGHDHDHTSHEHAHDHDHGHAKSSKKRNLNVQSAFLHVLGDAISSVGVIAAAVIIHFTKVEWIDPLISIMIGVIIFVSAFRVLKSAFHILIEGVPEGLSITEIKSHMATINGIKSVCDLHVWNLGSEQVSLSAHIVLEEAHENRQSAVMEELKNLLDTEFRIQHTTIQFEKNPCISGHGGCN